MKFYDCATAPSPRRVRMYLAEKGLDIPVVEVDLATREQHGEAFGKINDRRTVPVLQLEDGSSLGSTTGIWHYLEKRYPSPPLIGRDAAEYGHVVDLEWRIEQEGFMAVGESFRNKSRAYANNALTGSHEYNQIPELVDRGRKRAEHFFNWLDKTLVDRQFVAGDYFSIADISAFVTVEFAVWIKLLPTADQTALTRWHAAVSDRASSQV